MRTFSLLLTASTLAACTLDIDPRPPGPGTAATAAELTTTDVQTATTLFSGLDAPFGIASAGDGTVWVSEQGASAPGKVTRRTLTGTVVETVTYGWDNPEGLHVDDAGTLWIAETSLGQFLRYDGFTLEVVGQGLGLPVVITSSGPGSLLANSANGPAQLLGIDVLP
jgi:streptogramin lyase